MNGSVAHTKIKCKRTEDDVVLISYGGIANFWDGEEGTTELRCPYSNGSGCELTPKKRIMPDNPRNLTECHKHCFYDK